ncbi:hypothetical protein BHE90_002972 [Fusarium euwallaceae]|uniref:ABC transmembrane type-1 domain-containing protein n=1 Tax=Fusarium euwallaceae TaxID=1147111 RepID=A0A430M3S4_9HYPO|nr:hypothetical protein BHE90_002972 [Fusarium euwallaceae]
MEIHRICYASQLSMADTGNLADMPKLLLWFAGLSTAQVILYMVFILLAYHLCIIPTAKRLHKALVASTLAHEMHYFERTPLGDILNYFTNDLARVDLSLSGSVLTLLAQYGNIMLVGVLLVASAPQSVALIVPAIFIFWALQRTYLTKLRELRSCDVTSRASILGFLHDSDAGRTIFSVFGMTEDRIQNQKYLLEENARAQFPLSSINSWLALLEALRESTADKALVNIREDAQNDTSVSLLDLVVDSRSSLSAGQVQFLSLARVILHGSRLLILDEESEAQFQEVIWKRCVNTTVISVMHRLESTLQYDKVLVLDKGSVAAFGSPKELVLGQNEYYCSMLKERGLEEQARLKFGAQRSA